MSYPQEALQQMREEFQTVAGKHTQLSEAYIAHNYIDDQALEHAHHGFLRRLSTLLRCIQNIFEIFPPDQERLPTREELSDIEINLQAFVFNVFGCVDNLAWMWVCEKSLTKEDGSPLRNNEIGLRRNNTSVRETFSQEFLEYLNDLEPWIKHLEDFRHAAAHRIPLYVAPYVITTDNEAAYQDLENRRMDALHHGALDNHERLSAEQDALKMPCLTMTHSFIEGANHVYFHPQMLADFNTIDELGWKMLEELDR